MLYAQLDNNNICTGVSNLRGEVPEYNYTDIDNFDPVSGETTSEQVFSSRMIKIPVYSENYLGLRYNNGSWETVEGV